MSFGDNYMGHLMLPILFVFAAQCALLLHTWGLPLWGALPVAYGGNGWLAYKLWKHFEARKKQDAEDK